MEELAKLLQRAQAAVLGVQDDLALLRAQVEEKAEGCSADHIVSAAAGLRTDVVLTNPYYVDLHVSVHEKQEAASQLFQRCAHIFYEQFGALEEKAARLENVRVKEKELHSAKKSMQRYFDAHSKELTEERDRHDGVVRLEWVRRHHLEDGVLRLTLERRRQRLMHKVLLVWMKKAMMRNLSREYTRRRDAIRETYQSATCDALIQQQRATATQRALCVWRSRMQQRRCQRLKTAAEAAEKRAQFFRDELAATQQTLHERLNREVDERDRVATAVANQEKECVQYEDDLHRLRTALRDMTVEFSERTRTYVRQQETIEQLFARKEATLRDTICSLQVALTTERQAHAELVKTSENLVDNVNAWWQAQLQELAEAVRRKEEYTHHTILGLTGRLRHRHDSLRQEAAKLERDVDTLAPLSERCVRLENELAEAEQLLKRSKVSSQSWERRCKAVDVVAALLTDRVASADSAALRARSFIRWMGRSHTTFGEELQRRISSLSDKLEAQRRQSLIQQQRQSSDHQAEVAQLSEELEQLRRANERLQSQLEAAARTQRERDGAYYDSEVRNGELSAAMLREKIERRGVEDKWWSSRASGLLLQEAQQRLYIEVSEGQWWTTLLMRESKVLKVWTASLHFDTAQLTTVCEGWQQHCHQIEATHAAGRKTAAGRMVGALERGALHVQTLAVWASWRGWAHQRRVVAALESRSSESRREMLEQHGKETARLQATHDRALQLLQREHALLKTQLQSMHEERCAALRRSQAEEVARLSERHAEQLNIAHTAYAADVAQRDEQAAVMQEQLENVGCLVVEYCAQASYSRWRAWATERKAQRIAWQRRRMITRIWEWHTARTTMIDACAAAKADLWASSSIEIAHENVVEARRQVQHVTQEKELCHSQQHKLQAAKEAAEEEASHLRGELQHVRTLYDAEVHYTERLLRTTTEERRSHRSTLVFTSRMTEWLELVHCSFAEYQAAAIEGFADATGKIMAEASVAHRAELAAYMVPVGDERAVRSARVNSAIASPSEIFAEKVHTFDGDRELDLSGRAPGEGEVDANTADVSSSDGGGQCRSTCAMAVKLPLVQVVPDDLLPRLRSIESYARAALEACEAGYEDDAAPSERCGFLLSESFLDVLPLSSPPLTTASSYQVEPHDVPWTVRHLLELVRVAAVRGAAAHMHNHMAERASMQEKCSRFEEAFASLRENMKGLLAEQRSLAGAMHADAQQQGRQYSTCRESGLEQGSLASTKKWQERLTALTGRCTRVLEAFSADSMRCKETFCSVADTLTGADEFSERFLPCCGENSMEVAALSADAFSQAQALASTHQGGHHPEDTTPADATAQVRMVPVSLPAPEAPFLHVTPASSPALGENLVDTACLECSSFGDIASVVVSPSLTGSTPERRGLRSRVHFLERHLVETKVQLAEAKSLAGVVQSAAPLAYASVEAQVWAAQDVEEFSELALSKEQLLVLYAASESTTCTLMTAMRDYKTKLHSTQEEMSRQLQAACAAVEDTLQARHGVDVARYEAKVRTLSVSLAAAVREQAKAETRCVELGQQLKSETASWAEKYSRDTELIRQSCLSEIEELADRQRLLEDELQQCRRAAQASVQQAVDRQTELLKLEHAEQLRRSEGRVARLVTEKTLLEGRLRSVEVDCERQVQQERAAVVRLQHRLEGDTSAIVEVDCVATLASWETHFFGIIELYAWCAADKAAWLTACVAGLMELEREQWETEVVQLRERVALLVEASAADAVTPARNRSFHGASANVHESGTMATPHGKAENSSQALTASPSPRRSNQDVSPGEGGACVATWDATAQDTPRRTVSSPSAAKTALETHSSMSATLHGTTPTRCRSLSLDSLELSQSFLRYSQMLSDQRSRNTTRLERANALAAEVEDLLFRGAQLSHSAAPPGGR
ncbi:hypothetical protein, conserved [Leishmania tarentolae]|uniref:Uncharacterized protein n=1 Tax=Leishmania tarentolae TaxID=5689 RepID=A0A640KQC5_LEITA|nr:hypothetical protein, conserved [Leishmania tarentolae]